MEATTFRLAIRAVPNSTNENVSIPSHKHMMRHTNFAVVDEEDEREDEEKSGDVRSKSQLMHWLAGAVPRSRSAQSR